MIAPRPEEHFSVFQGQRITEPGFWRVLTSSRPSRGNQHNFEDMGHCFELGFGIYRNMQEMSSMTVENAPHVTARGGADCFADNPVSGEL